MRGAHPEAAPHDVLDLAPVVARPLAPVLEAHAQARHVHRHGTDADGDRAGGQHVPPGGTGAEGGGAAGTAAHDGQDTVHDIG